MLTRVSSLLAALFMLAALPADSLGQMRRPQVDPRIYMERAAEGDAESQFQLGLIMTTAERATDEEVETGAEWVLRAAKQEHVPAMHVIGSYYEEGIGVNADPKHPSCKQRHEGSTVLSGFARGSRERNG
jgi:TPR repeat protein